MSASHRPTLRTLVERCLRDECRVERGEKVLLAVSGGVDSTALLHVMASLSESFFASRICCSSRVSAVREAVESLVQSGGKDAGPTA